MDGAYINVKKKIKTYKYQESFLKLSFKMFWYHSVDITEFMPTLIINDSIMLELAKMIYKRIIYIQNFT